MFYSVDFIRKSKIQWDRKEFLLYSELFCVEWHQVKVFEAVEKFEVI